MSEICEKIGCPEVIRLSLQDACTGEPVPGAANGAVLRCTRNASLEKVLRDEEVSEFVADCGQPDRYVQESQLQGFNLSFEVSKFSPETEALLTGDNLVTSGGDNVGVLYEAQLGCVDATPRPRFVAEVFFRRRGACRTGSDADYLRYVVPGIRFNPSEVDAEGQIRIMRFTGASEPALLGGLLSVNDGPYADFPAGVVTDLGAYDAEAQTHGFWFFDPINDPVAGLTLAEGTCYTATVPAS